jgi:multicomponent Na+:H+ antiporter subunit D
MPLTAAAMVTCALSMIGLPPFAGFFSKWYLAMGAIEKGQYLYVAVLILSSLLSAIYFFRIFERMFMDQGPAGQEGLESLGEDRAASLGEPSVASLGKHSAEGTGTRREASLPWQMLIPMAVVIVAIFGIGLANSYLVSEILKPTILEVFLT